jgi:hypothetical protein
MATAQQAKPAPKTSPQTASPATTGASEQQVMALFDAIHLKDMLKVSERNVLTFMAPMLQEVVGASGANIDAEDRKYITDLVQKQAAKTFGPDYLDEVAKMAVPVYQQHMTQEDIKATTAFFSSPSGQRYLSGQNEIQKALLEKISPIAQARAEQMRKELQPQVEAYLSKKYPKGGTGTPSAPTPTQTPKSGTTTPSPSSTPTPSPSTTPSTTPKG